MLKVRLGEWFLFGWDKVKLFLVVDIRVIVRFLFKMFFSRIKSNLKDIFFKRSFELFGILKGLLKIVFTYLNILIIEYFYSHFNKKPSGQV